MDSLSRIEAERACERQVMRYALAVNAWDLDMFVSLFTPDAVWQRPKVAALNGHAEIRAFMEGQPVDRTIRHVNGLCMVTIDEGGDTAQSISQTTVYEAAGRDAIPAPLAGVNMIVEYRDRLIKVGDTWLFSRRDTTVIFAAWA